jgi:hypothetical protein
MIPRWLALVFERVEGTDTAFLDVLVLHSPMRGPGSCRPTLHHLWEDFIVWAHRSIERLQVKVEPDAQCLFDVQAKYPSVTAISASADGNGDNGLPMDQVARLLRARELDIIIKMAPGVPADAYDGLTRHGVWTILHDGVEVGVQDPQGFWSVMMGQTITTLSLQGTDGLSQRTAELSRAVLHVDRHSVLRATNNFLWNAASLLLNAIARTATQRPHNTGQTVESHDGANTTLEFPGSSTIRRRSAITLVAGFFWTHFLSKLMDITGFDQWILVVTHSNDIYPSAEDSHVILPPRDRFWADPAFVVESGKRYVFFEEFMVREEKGHISVSVLGDDGRLDSPRVVLMRPYHLSYPFVFKYQGSYFMVPESSRNSTIDLYKALAFPDEWVLESTLIDNIRAWDSTLLRYRGKWWLFCTVADLQGTSGYDSLYLFSSRELRGGGWVPHPMNPVVADARRARPAGRIFWHKGNMYRPAQDCSERYGGRITMNRIVELNESRYEEVVDGQIFCDQDSRLTAVHTVNGVGNTTILDAVVRWPRPLFDHPNLCRSTEDKFRLRTESFSLAKPSREG